MAGNSQRKGATRLPGTKKGAVVGSGGRKSKGLVGRKPTPKAEERTGHPAARKAASAARRSDSPSGKRGPAAGRSPAGNRSGAVSRGGAGTPAPSGSAPSGSAPTVPSADAR